MTHAIAIFSIVSLFGCKLCQLQWRSEVAGFTEINPMRRTSPTFYIIIMCHIDVSGPDVRKTCSPLPTTTVERFSIKGRTSLCARLDKCAVVNAVICLKADRETSLEVHFSCANPPPPPFLFSYSVL